MTEASNRLDRVEQNLVQSSDRITALQEFMEANARANQAQMATINQTLANVTLIVEQMGERASARLQQHGLELDDHDERIERLERDHVEHADRMVRLEEIQTDIRQILQFVTNRLSGQ